MQLKIFMYMRETSIYRYKIQDIINAQNNAIVVRHDALPQYY